MEKTHAGFVAIIGPTNTGKSTLLNQIMGKKVSIVSHKVQTTRTRLRAIKMVGIAPNAAINEPVPDADASARGKKNALFVHPITEGATNKVSGDSLNKPPVQLIFVDTPGVFKPSRRLERAMVASSLESLSDADAILLVIDAKHGITETIRGLAKKLALRAQNIGSAPIYALINKTDLVKKPELLPIAAGLMELAPFNEIFMASALMGDGLDKLLETLAAVMPESPYLYETTDRADVPDELYLAELTREKIYKYIHQELPYHIHVITEKVDVDPDGVLEIYQKILVNSENHKKIVVGSGGAQLKVIGTEARHDIQTQWDVKARLHLFVRVEPDWEEKRENYEEQGLEYGK